MRTSLDVADIFRVAGPAYRTAHAGHLSLHQLKVMSAIEHRRTAVMGGHVEACTDCGHWRVAYNSCRNRHCPRCQGAAARTWLVAYLGDAPLWFGSFQNWQSEFLSTAVLVVLSIFLRQRESTESKAVGAPHWETGT